MTVPSTKTGLALAESDTDSGSRRGIRAAGGGMRRAALPRRAGNWLVAGVFVLLFFSAAAPSPLYGVYQAQWRFSATTLTAVFAVYALALLVALLVFGSVSDYLGRRGVILASLVMAAGACGLFVAAHGVGMLFAARALQGAAVGTGTSALGAALIDLQPEGSAMPPVITIAAGQGGLAAGGLGTSALIQYGPAPTRLVWWLLFGVSLAAAVAVLAMPETVSGRPGVLASLRPRVAVPRQARGTFAMALPCLIAAWMLSGFCLSLGPSLATEVVGSQDLLWGGLVIFVVAGTGAAGPVIFRGVSGPSAMLAGCLLLLAGAMLTLAAIETTSTPAFLVGVAVAGAGFGTATLGALRSVSVLAAPGQRASLIAAIFIVSYVALSIPVVVAGVAVTHAGLHRTALVYCAVIAVLVAVAGGRLIARRHLPNAARAEDGRPASLPRRAGQPDTTSACFSTQQD